VYVLLGLNSADTCMNYMNFVFYCTSKHHRSFFFGFAVWASNPKKIKIPSHDTLWLLANFSHWTLCSAQLTSNVIIYACPKVWVLSETLFSLFLFIYIRLNYLWISKTICQQWPPHTHIYISGVWFPKLFRAMYAKAHLAVKTEKLISKPLGMFH
jgi:hypothetical protein